MSDLSDLRMNHAWHIENLIEADSDCQVVLIDVAESQINSLQSRIEELEQEMSIDKDILATITRKAKEANGDSAACEYLVEEICANASAD